MARVVYLPEAEEERKPLPVKEKAALVNADKKLGALGPNLIYPHSSAVKGVTEPLRELRPRGGRSPWRAFYRQTGETFTVAAGRTGSSSQPARVRPSCLSGARTTSRDRGRITMNRPEPRRAEDIAADEMRDPALRREYERTAFANAVAIRVIAYRVKHHLSQSALARRLGMTPPAIARLEAADHEPSLTTLDRLAKGLGMDFSIDITPTTLGLRDARRGAEMISV